MTDLLDAQPLAGPGAYPVPAGRGRWRLTLHDRTFQRNLTWTQSILAELPTAHTRKLVQQLDETAVLTFSLDGWSPAAAQVQELWHEVIAWRWDDTTGKDEPLFRGVVTDSEDDIDEQSHQVIFTCHDYLAVLNRRFMTSTQNYANTDQDDIVLGMLNAATTQYTSGGTVLTPGSLLPIVQALVNPDGSSRSKSGFLRQRSYLPQQNVWSALYDLSQVQANALPGNPNSFYNAFDFDLTPGWRFGSDNANDQLRVFYPQQGVNNTTALFYYPGNLAKIKRQVASTDYANYVRVLGNNQSASASTPQLYAEQLILGDAAGVNTGLWMDGVNAADVIDQTTLNEKAAGDVNTSGVLQPTYTLTLAPNVYYSRWFQMGDTVQLAINSGRLAVNTQVRVVGIEYDIGDDGQEDLVLTVGRPNTTLYRMLSKQKRDINALARR